MYIANRKILTWQVRMRRSVDVLPSAHNLRYCFPVLPRDATTRYSNVAQLLFVFLEACICCNITSDEDRDTDYQISFPLAIMLICNIWSRVSQTNSKSAFVFLTLTMLGKNFIKRNFEIYFFHFCQKIDIVIS